MDTIQRVLEIAGFKYGFAAADGKRCHPGNAYKATGVVDASNAEIAIPAGAEVVVVECRLNFREEVTVIDHHRPGDPGFGQPPANALVASSLGQVLALLGQDWTSAYKAVAAADHNLAAAYAGEIPGVSAEDVLEVRLPELAARNRVSLDEARNGIAAASVLLSAAKYVQIGAYAVKDIRSHGVQPYALEAATMGGVAFMGHVDSRDPKKVMLSAAAPVVAEFLQRPLEGITGVYGDPARGFAGGTQE